MRGSEDTLTFVKGVFKNKIAAEWVAMKCASLEESIDMTPARRQTGEGKVAAWDDRIASIDRPLSPQEV
jgi:hypothetical protein